MFAFGSKIYSLSAANAKEMGIALKAMKRLWVHVPNESDMCRLPGKMHSLLPRDWPFVLVSNRTKPDSLSDWSTVHAFRSADGTWRVL